MIKALLKGSSIYGGAPFIPRILSVLLLPIMTKYLTSQDYGIIGTITSILFAMQAFQTLGLQSLLPTYFYKCPVHYKVVWRDVYGFLIIWMAFFALLQTIVLYFFIPDCASDNRWTIIILSVFANVLFGPTAIIGQLYYQLNLRPMPVAVRAVVSGFLTILANFVCVVWLRWGYLGAYVGTFAGVVFTNISYWFVVNFKLRLTPILNFKKKTILKLLKVSMPTIPHFYTTFLLNSSNTISMNYYHKPQSEIGGLTMSQNFSNMFDGFIHAINQVFGPMQLKFIKENNRFELKRMMILYVLITYSLTFTFSLWSKEIYMLLVHNEELVNTYKLSIFLIMALNYRPIYVYCSSYFFYHERTKPLLLITFVAGILACLIYFVFVPSWGAWAAVVGFFIGCLYFGYSGLFFPFYKKVNVCDLKLKPLCLVQIMLTLSALYLVDGPLMLKILVYVAFLMLVLGTFKMKVKTNRIRA